MADEIESSQPFIEGRGQGFCRGCLEKQLFSALNLGNLPIANELLIDKDAPIEKYPLHLRVCVNCGLGQVADVVTPARIFRDYRYLSSMSTTFLQHASDFVDQQIQNGLITKADWVLEIASNDGYLLKNFIRYGIPTLGIEPAENVAELARSQGVKTISDFFSRELANKLVLEKGYPRLIIANNVMAHVPDLVDFIQGLAALCGPDTNISIENPSLMNIYMEMQFDTIYHEHYSYLSANSVSKLSELNGLQLFKVEKLETHGGSNRYWLRQLHSKESPDNSVVETKISEMESGLFEPERWIDYADKVKRIHFDLCEWLSEDFDTERRIYGYGAAAKASTILNSCGGQVEKILAIADASQEKQGRYMPPSKIRIISPDELYEMKPTDILIFPWNIKKEILENLSSNLGDSIQYWCIIPEMRKLSRL